MRCLSASGQQAAAKPQFQESGHVKLCQVTFISGVRRDPAVVDCLIQRSIELLNQPIQFGGPLTVPVQFPLQLLCGVVLLKLGGGVHLLHKAFLIRARVGADGSDGVKNQCPNCLCGNVVSKTLPCFLFGTQTVSGAVIVVTGIKAAFGVDLHTVPERPAAPLVVIHLGSAVGAEQQTR